MNQCGIAEAIAEAIQECPKEIRPSMWSSIILVGGGALLPGLEARLYSELTSLCPTEYSGLVGIYTPKDPLGSTWKGGSIMGCRQDMFSSSLSQSASKSSLLSITKADYFEKGSLYLDLENRFTL
jgi:actin-related protein